MPTRTLNPTCEPDARDRRAVTIAFASVNREEWIRALLAIAAIVLAIGLVELSRHAAGIPARSLSAVAASTALALVAVGLELGSPGRAIAALLAAIAAFSLACAAGSQPTQDVMTCAAFGVQALSTGTLALMEGGGFDRRGSLLWVGCVFHATVAASVAFGS